MSSATEFGARMAQDLDRIKLRVDKHMATKDDLAELRTELHTGLVKIPEMIREVLRQETPAIQLRSLVAAGSLSLSLAGLAVMVLTDEFLRAIALEHGSVIGLMMILASSVALLFLARPSRS